MKRKIKKVMKGTLIFLGIFLLFFFLFGPALFIWAISIAIIVTAFFMVFD